MLERVKENMREKDANKVAGKVWKKIIRIRESEMSDNISLKI